MIFVSLDVPKSESRSISIDRAKTAEGGRKEAETNGRVEGWKTAARARKSHRPTNPVVVRAGAILPPFHSFTGFFRFPNKVGRE
jgi:hypothetical protein